MDDRRLIEETFPVKEVSEESAREKNVSGQISSLHVWWARRPLSASRTTGYSALIPLPESPGELERKRKFIVKLGSKESTADNALIEKARDEILDANRGRPPKVIDPFSGGGSIPFEALRLGCETYASDYNPVATLILKCTLEYPQKYGGRKKARDNGFASHAEDNVLLNDVMKWGKTVAANAQKQLQMYYPPEKDGSIVVGYIWARIIPCQNPACGSDIPLMRQFWLANKNERKISLYPFVIKDKVQFKVVGSGYEKMPKGFDPKRGTVSRAVATCLVCKSVVDDKTTMSLFRGKKAGEKMIAVVTQRRGIPGKRYRIATEADEETVARAAGNLVDKSLELQEEWGMSPIPDEPTPEGKGRGAERAFSLRNYGLDTWADLFNPRQKLALLIFANEIVEAQEQMSKAGLDDEYSKAVASFLALTFDRMAMSYNTLNQWQAGYEKMGNMFSRQALPIVWDYAEPNAVGEGVRSWHSLFEDTIDVILQCSQASTNPATVTQNSALSIPYPDGYFDAVFTDPPYYDNVPYSYLSDFFYVWLKRIIGNRYPDLFSTPLTPKTDEIVAYSNVPGGFEGGKKLFEDKLKGAFLEVSRILRPNGIALIVYAHKSTAGWETLINSILESGLIVTGAWPIHTERKTRMRGQESAALASSIYMVARKMRRQPTGFYSEVKQELKAYLNRKLDKVWAEGISGADFFISAIGSAIEVFGKYDKVIDDEGTELAAAKLLDDVRRIVTDYAVKQVLHNGFAGEIKPLTRFYVLWRWAYGTKILDFDEAMKLGQSIGIDVSREWKRGFISKDKEFIEVLGPEERELDDLNDSSELIDVLHRVLLLWKKGRYAEVTKVLRDTGYGKSDVFYRVAQAISESLANGNKEKKLLDGFLSGKERIVKEVKKQVGQTRLTE